LTELYQRHGVARWQLWVQEEHHALHALVRAAGLVVDTTTVAMAQDLTRTAWRPQPSLDLIRAPGGADLCGLLENAEVRVPQFRAAGAHLYAVRSAGEPASYVVSFEYAGDCGLYGVGTADRFRRRGLATALVRQALWEARERGCTSASLQATAMAERVYAALGFEALGRYVEWQYRGAP
jgi:GNAT superfamily N-acetyltransferase